jgi:HlyD family secretion protein
MLMIAPFDGVLAEVRVEEGDVVQAGQVLAKMDDELQTLQVELAKMRADTEAEIRAANAAYGLAIVQHKRVTQMAENDASTAFELERAKAELDQASAQLDRANESKLEATVTLKLRQEELERYELKAPFDGEVIRVMAEAGAVLTRENEILAIASRNPLEATICLPSSLWGRLELGREYNLIGRIGGDDSLASAAPGATDGSRQFALKGKLKYINPIIEYASRQYACVFTIENPGAELPAGFDVELVWPQ